MAIPTTGTLTAIGVNGGMSPHAVHVSADLDTWDTGSGEWCEGRWEWHATKDNGSDLDSQDRIQSIDPINGSSVYIDQRFNAAPTFAYFFISPGTYVIKCRYQNRDGDWSGWVSTSLFIVAANSRQKRFVNGTNGNDAWDGTAPAFVSGVTGPKQTLGSMAAEISGDDWDIEIADGTSTAEAMQVDLRSNGNVWIHRSGGGAKPALSMQQSGGLIRIGNSEGIVIDGIVFDFDGTTERLCTAWETGLLNVCFVDCETNECQSFCEIASSAYPDGILLLNCRQNTYVTRYVVFISAGNRLNIIGCDFSNGGSTTEHILRIMSQDGNGFITKFVSVDYVHSDYASQAGGKNSLRVFVSEHFGSHRSIFAHGKVEIGSIDGETGSSDIYRNHCIDQCLIDNRGTISTSQFSIRENVIACTIRSSVIIKENSQSQPSIHCSNRGGTGAGTKPIEKLFIRNNVIVAKGSTYSRWYMTSDTTMQITGNVISGNVLMTDESEWGTANRMQIQGDGGTPENPPSGFAFMENVIYEGNNKQILNVGSEDALRSAAEINAMDWAMGNIEESHESVDVLTGALSNSSGTQYLSLVTDITGVFAGYNGVELRRSDSSWAAGAWQAGSQTSSPLPPSNLSVTVA